MDYLQQYKKLSAGRNLNSSTSDQDQLRYELGWKDVASGLMRMLMGYLLLLVIAAFAIALVVYLMSAAHHAAQHGISNKGNLSLLWITIAGGGAITILSLIAYGLILTGTWRCAIHAPERSGARWMIFACVVLLVCSPLMSIAIGVSGVSRPAAKHRAVSRSAALQEHLPQIGVADLIGPVLSLGTTVLFVLFLRAVGNCFQNKRLIVFSEMYLVVESLLAGGAVFLVFNPTLPEKAPLVILIFAGAALVSVVGYLGLIVIARNTIVQGMAAVKSPLLATR